MEEARLSQAAMHPGGQERALEPQTTAAELQLVGLARQTARGAKPVEASLLLRLGGYQHLYDGARSLRPSLWTRDRP